MLIEGEVVSARSRRGRGRLQILTAQVSDGSGQISATWFNQPWLQEKLRPGTRVRLRGAPNRYGFAVRSYDLNGGSATADFAPVYPASEEVSTAKLRELVSAVLVHARDDPDPLPVCGQGRAAAAAEGGRPRRAPPATLARGGGGGQAAPRLRRAADAPARARAAGGRARVGDGGCAPARGRADRALPGVAAVRAHARTRRRRSPRSTPTSAGRSRCGASSRATSARGRPWSRSMRFSARSRPGARER